MLRFRKNKVLHNVGINCIIPCQFRSCVCTGEDGNVANQALITKIPHDIEYRAIGNAFGMLIAAGGLLAGAMVTERSLDYWQDDIVPLGLLVFMGFRLLRNLMATMTLYQEAPPAPRPHTPPRETVASEPMAMPQLPQSPDFTPEQVVEEVVKRIEAQKAEQAKKAEKQAKKADKNMAGS